MLILASIGKYWQVLASIGKYWQGDNRPLFFREPPKPHPTQSAWFFYAVMTVKSSTENVDRPT